MSKNNNHLNQIIEETSKELFTSLESLPGYDSLIEYLKNSKTNSSSSIFPQEWLPSYFINLFQTVSTEHKHKNIDSINTKILLCLILSDDDIDNIETNRRLVYGLYLYEALDNLKVAKEKIENDDYISALKACNAAYLSKGMMRGHELGLNDGVIAAKKMASSNARRTKQAKADERKKQIVELFEKFQEEDPNLSKNKASRKIADKVFLAPEVVRRHLQNL